MCVTMAVQEQFSQSDNMCKGAGLAASLRINSLPPDAKEDDVAEVSGILHPWGDLIVVCADLV